MPRIRAALLGVTFVVCLAGHAAWAQPVPEASPAAALSPRSDATRAALRATFERRLETIASGLDGVMGFCVVDLTTGERFTRLADQAFPTASSIKIAILYELYAQAEQGRVRLDDVRPLTDATRVGGSGVLQELQSPALTLVDYATLMVMVSDNSATNLLIDLLGQGRHQPPDARTRPRAGLAAAPDDRHRGSAPGTGEPGFALRSRRPRGGCLQGNRGIGAEPGRDAGDPAEAKEHAAHADGACGDEGGQQAWRAGRGRRGCGCRAAGETACTSWSR